MLRLEPTPPENSCSTLPAPLPRSWTNVWTDSLSTSLIFGGWTNVFGGGWFNSSVFAVFAGRRLSSTRWTAAAVEPAGLNKRFSGGSVQLSTSMVCLFSFCFLFFPFGFLFCFLLHPFGIEGRRRKGGKRIGLWWDPTGLGFDWVGLRLG